MGGPRAQNLTRAGLLMRVRHEPRLLRLNSDSQQVCVFQVRPHGVGQGGYGWSGYGPVDKGNPEDLSSNPQHPHTKSRAYKHSVGEQRKAEPKRVLTSQLSPNGKLLVCRETLSHRP